jgi:hypothetical protein
MVTGPLELKDDVTASVRHEPHDLSVVALERD